MLQARFNGASVFQPRKGRQHGHDYHDGVRFNGASVFQPRKDVELPPFPQGRWKLQWGLGLSTEEGAGGQAEETQENEASMGPRSFNRGRRRAHDVTPSERAASMGPRSFNRGRKGKLAAVDRGEEASMGPRSFNRGRTSLGLTAASRGMASMGPRSFNRGRVDIRLQAFHLIRASMGPRSFNRGRLRVSPKTAREMAGFNGASVFQPRKGGPDRAPRTPSWVLQWGLGLSTEEGTAPYAPTGISKTASMGPRSFNRGRLRGRSTTNSRKTKLQWGLGLSTEEGPVANPPKRNV